jgi:hypothetical protein
MEIVTREEIRQKLREWHSGIISTDAIQTWASERWMSDHHTYEDWEYDGEASASNDVLAAIDMLDINLTTKEDAEIFIEFLETPLGEYPRGHSKMKERIRLIDFDDRKRSLRTVAPYSSFLK